MSWQTYVDDHLMCDIDGTGHHLTAAAILGHDGSVWAQSTSFPQFKPDEITGIMKDFDEPGHLAPTGLHLGGAKYMVIQGEAGAVIRGKKEGEKEARVVGREIFKREGNKLAHLLAQFALQEPNKVWMEEVPTVVYHQGSGGITIKKTGQALVFGIYEEPVTPGQCNMVVERLGDYLVDQGL